MRKIKLVVYRSTNGRDGWQPVSESQVPDWVKEPAVIGRMMQGEQCMDPRSTSGSDWFKAQRVITQAEKDAQERREQRQAKRVRH